MPKPREHRHYIRNERRRERGKSGPPTGTKTGTTEQTFTNPTAAYTRQLIGAVPVIGADELALRNALKLNEAPQ